MYMSIHDKKNSQQSVLYIFLKIGRLILKYNVSFFSGLEMAFMIGAVTHVSMNRKKSLDTLMRLSNLTT